MEWLFTIFSDALGKDLVTASVASAGWGVMSILLSPCHLASIPLIVGYLSGRGETQASRTFALSLSFALGILATISAIGAITAATGRILGDIGPYSSYLVAVVFLLVSLVLLDVVHVPVLFHTTSQPRSKSGLPGAVLLGLVFGTALGPCTFAFLAPILGLVFQLSHFNLASAVVVLLSFAAGHCAVIVSAGMVSGKVQSYLAWTERSHAVLWIRRVSGVLILLAGGYFVYTAS